MCIKQDAIIPVNHRRSWEGRHHWKKRRTAISGLIYVNRATHDEVSSILYSSNTFSFLGTDCWKDLHKFVSNLTEVCRQNVTRLQINFPSIERKRASVVPGPGTSWFAVEWNIKSRFSLLGRVVVHDLARLSGLKHVTMCLEEDILASDVGLLEKLASTLPKGCELIVKFRQRSPPQQYYRSEYLQWLRQHDTLLDDSYARLSYVALEKMQALGIEVIGEVDVIDRDHLFANEEQWLFAMSKESAKWN